MEIDACYITVPLSGKSDNLGQRNTSPRMARQREPRLKIRSQRRRRHVDATAANVNVDDFEQATDFLHHFHAITSRSLDVIHETNGFEDTDELSSSPIHEAPSSFGLPSIRRTKTCSSLLEAQTSAIIGNHQDWFSDESRGENNDDEEWGFYSEESEPSWSATTWKHGSSYFRR